MAERLQLPIPMWRAQYQLLGGHRRVVSIAVVYVAALITGFFGVKQLMPKTPTASYISGTLMALTGLQFLMALLAGCNAVHRAMLRDFQTRMLESHRLTPMSNSAVVLGYLFGSTLQHLLMITITAGFGAILVVVGGFNLSDWIMGNVLLLSIALMLWAVAVFLGLRPAKPVNPAPIVVVIALLSYPAGFVPTAGMMLGSYSAFLAAAMLSGNMINMGPAALALSVLNVILAGFWASAAAAKYRRPELPALGAARGLILLGLALVYGIGGAAVIRAFGYRNLVAGLEDRDTVTYIWAITLGASLLIAVVPVVGAGHSQRLIAQGTKPRSRLDLTPDWVAALIATVMICLVGIVVGWPLWRNLIRMTPNSAGNAWTSLFPWYVTAWGVTGTVCLTALLAARGLYALTARWLKSGAVAGTAFLLFYWTAPVITDLVRTELVSNYGKHVTQSWLVAMSPPGALGAVWLGLDISLWPGLLFQIALAVALTLLARQGSGNHGPGNAAVGGPG